MRLFTRYNRANFIVALIILLASSVTYYFIIRYILITQIDKDLKVEEQEIVEFVHDNNALPNASAYKGQVIQFERATNTNIQREIKSSSIPNAAKDEDEPIRVLTFPIKVNGVLHKAIVIKSQVEAEDLLKLIVLVTGGVFLLLLVVMSFINRFLLSKLWRPFYQTLQQLKIFNIKNPAAMALLPTQIDEFKELNNSVSDMTNRAACEFKALKEFTDNASHEMQTPLAIINSKLDLLLQTAGEKQVEQLQAIYDATGRLSKLNQTLLLLTKIENDQYNEQERLDFKLLVENKLQQFDELIKSRSLQVHCQLRDAGVNINRELADILLNNLLGNAIKHNHTGGTIHVALTHATFTISNTGAACAFDEKQIFHRFKKSNRSDGTGLGLAVVHQICESSGFNIEYSYEQQHKFIINFYVVRPKTYKSVPA